ncbi:MAG: hypothetical protein ACOC38_07560 [Promethearchaeia archaeon]
MNSPYSKTMLVVVISFVLVLSVPSVGREQTNDMGNTYPSLIDRPAVISDASGNVYDGAGDWDCHRQCGSHLARTIVR